MIFPVPQKNALTGDKITADSFSVSGTGREYAVRFLKSNNINISNNGMSFLAEISPEKAFFEADGQAFSTDELYRITVTKEQFSVVGSGKRGLHYGMNTFLKLLKNGELKTGELTDYPMFKMRGYIEGFYGSQWQYEKRRGVMELMAKNNMNTYFYAPKDDAFHREKWREHYPEKELSELRELYLLADENLMDFFWCIGPGLTYEYTSEKDYSDLFSKLLGVYEIGVRSFGLLLDDIPSDFNYESDKKAFPDMVTAHTELICRLYRDLTRFDKSIKLAVCPTQYSGDENGDYIVKFGNNIPTEVFMFWTGEEICSRVLKVYETKELIKNTGHMPLFWDNYPVNDCEMFNEMHLDGITGRDRELYKYCDGLISNVMEYAECSKLPLLTIADFLWNPASYDKKSSYDNACKTLLGDKAELFSYFADHMGVSCLSKYSSSYMSEKLAHIAFLQASGNSEAAFNEFSEYNAAMRSCLSMLLTDDEPMFKELSKWVKKFEMCCELLELILETQRNNTAENKSRLSEALEKYNNDAVLLTGFCLREAAQKTLAI